MKTLALFASLILIGCTNAPPTTTRYLLPADVPAGTARVEPPVQIGLSRVAVAPYLGRGGLVIETESHQIRPARYHVWAEPLAEGMYRFMVAEISKALGYDVSGDTRQQSRWDRTVDISIDRLHGNLSGQAMLVARWRITPKAGAGEPATFRFAASEPLPREGYAGLVDAEISLARRFAEAIANSLREAPAS